MFPHTFYGEDIHLFQILGEHSKKGIYVLMGMANG